MAHKPANNLRKAFVHLKYSTPMEKICGSIYQVGCTDCDNIYIGESGRQLNTRIKEHRKSVSMGTSSSALSEHSMRTGHSINWDGVKVIDQESSEIKRKIKEAISIRRHHPKLNRDGGYELSKAYNGVIAAAHQAVSRSTNQSDEVFRP